MASKKVFNHERHEKARTFLELGGVLTVTFRNSTANFRLFSPTDPTDPTDLLDPSDPTDQSEKPIGQITNSRAGSSGKATNPIQNFRVFSWGSWFKKLFGRGLFKE